MTVGEPGKRRSLKRTALVALSSVAVLLLVFCILIFSSPRRFRPEPVTVNDTMLQATLAAQLYGQIAAADAGEDRAELILSADQLDVIVKMLLNAAAVCDAVNRRSGALSAQPFTANFADGWLDFSVSLDTECPWLFGGAVVFSGRGMLNASGGTEALEFDSLRIGSLPVPGALGEMAFERVMRPVRETNEYRRFRPAVDLVEKLESGAVKIVYRPFAFKEYLPDLRKVMSGQSSINK